jgi:hypothetical protein
MIFRKKLKGMIFRKKLKGMIFRKKFKSYRKNVLIFSTNLFEIFLILRRNERDIRTEGAELFHAVGRTDEQTRRR